MSIIRDGKTFLKQKFPTFHAKWADYKYHPYRGYINKYILSQSNQPQYYNSDKIFHQLQDSYTPKSEYGYDSFTTWRRGTERLLKLLMRLQLLQQPGLTVLDAACGDGMVGYAFANYGHEVTLVDMDDWRDNRAKTIQFVKTSLTSTLPFEENYFGLIVSYNAFEHIDDPKTALLELLRVLKKGGFIYLEFGPLYDSPWGLHAFSSLKMPYPQFLFSEDFIKLKVKEFGIYDLGKWREDLQPLNKWHSSQYERLWNEVDCDIVFLEHIYAQNHLDIVKKYSKAFVNRQLTYEDLITAGYKILFRKN